MYPVLIVAFNIVVVVYLVFFTELRRRPMEGFSAGLIDDDDIYKWEVLVIGPQDTCL